MTDLSELKGMLKRRRRGTATVVLRTRSYQVIAQAMKRAALRAMEADDDRG